MSDFFQDVRFALRLLARDRSFTITALLTLAICIGANTAMFSVVRSVLLRPLPFPDSDSVVLLYNSYPNAGAPRVGNAVPDYFDRLTAVPALQELSVFREEGMNYGDESGAARLKSLRATPSFFRLVRQTPAQGRLFTDAEGTRGNDRKVLLSYGFWQRRFGGRPSVVGTAIRLNGNQYDIVGVMPRGFTFLTDDTDIYMAASFTPEDRSDERRHSNNWQMAGRLAPGASIDTVRQQIEALNAANDRRFPNFHQILADARFHTVSVMLQDDVVRDVKGVLYLLWGGVLFVLLIGCVNIGNLVMVRASGRVREMATRHAIGGDLGRLARQLVTETIVLAASGGVLGVAIGWWALRWIAALRLDELPRGYEIRLDGPGVVALLVLTLLVGVVLGLAPAFRLWRMNLNAELRQESRGGTSSRRANIVRRALATAQVALALVLLIGAGLLLASFRAVLELDYGFTPDHVTTASISLPGASYKDAPARQAFTERALAAIRSLPGVEAAGVTSALPFAGSINNNLILAEGYTAKPGESLLAPSYLVASAGYFEAMKIAVVSGRAFDARDTADAPGAIIIDERLARKFWPGQDAVGHRMFFPTDLEHIDRVTPETKFLNVVGVVREVQMLDPRADVTPVGTYYIPSQQSGNNIFSLAVRTTGSDPSIANGIRREIARIDPQLAVYRVQPMQTVIDAALVGRRVPMLIAIAFALVALFLSAIGIYGVLAHSVSERRRELGVRMALGGTAGTVFGLVLRDGLRVLGAGLVIGLAGAFFLARLMQNQLFDVAPVNPVVFGGVTITLAVVALVAVSVPALRASRIEPSVVLGK
jgi:predicted permease